MVATQVVLPHGRALADELVAELSHGGVRAEPVAAIRQAIELIGEIVLVCDHAPSEVLAILGRSRGVELNRIEGGLEGSITLDHGPLYLRIRCTSPRGFVDAVLRESATAEHIAALEARAAERGTTLAAITHESADETAVYAALDLELISPELRDDGSLESPAVLSAIRGVFHAHTTWSDGLLGVAPMARAALERGLEYLGVSDHTRAAHYANGLDIDRLREQRREVTRARREVPGITILHGVECDILEDGTLDLPDEELEPLDFVIASVHSHLDLPRGQQTRRVMRALGHPHVSMLGHPTGRLLLAREPSQIDLDEVARAAAQNNVFLEMNTTAQRLDLSANQARRAAAVGASFVINPDAHEPRGFDTLPFGVLLARRARLSAERVLNTRSVDEVRSLL